MRLTMKFNGQSSIVAADQKGATLDLSTVKTSSDATPRTRNRIFGLQEAPTYYPTHEEFAEPIKYIQKITPEAEKFGIIKIVPPEGYKPDFCLNTEAFRFKTRIQKLNSMEGETRANVNYLEQLYKFHRLNGHPISKVPQLDKRPIDLFKLKKEVAQRGGYQAVTQQKKWAEVGRVLGYTRKQCTSMSNALKTAYTKVILPYEVWLAKHKEEQLKATPPPVSQGGMKRADQPPSEASSSNGSSNTFTGCEVCHSTENEDEILLCDGCDRGYHMQCLTPPLASVPKSDWYCVKCLTAAGGDYGFEDGGEYSLKDFQEKCDKFKTEWFKKPYLEVSEEDCEDEFWRLVENPHETCEVEYGADLHSTHHGSGFSSLERTDKGVFCKDPWNLNMIPILPESLFTHIKTDISGMMVPWLYIGMCFSAFCWHNEDHYTYSINYMHWGETKTWYGVPGSDTAKFEDTMRAAVPELFEQQPDLLFQLVTMLSPGRLLKENVQVYAVDQRPGQFVVTFPKAYHSGFNHGFNFCEAVNFAPPEWVEYGLECVKRYQQYRRQPCFSHDELLVTTAREDPSTETATWLKDALADMQQRELGQRQEVKKRYPKMQSVVITEELPEEQQQCNYCNAYAYLSQIGCECTTKVACLEHVQDLCSCDASKKTLRIRMTEEQMQELLDNVLRAAYRPCAWTEKVQAALEAQPRPNLKTLRHFLSEAEKFPVEEVGWLREHVEKVQAWIDEASKLVVVRKHQHRRRESREEKKYDGERYNRIEQMLQEASQLAFDAPEIDSLQELFGKLTEIKERSKQLLQDRDCTLEQCKELYEMGTDIGADIPEMQQLETSIKRFEWWAAAPKAILDSSVSYDEVVRLIEQGKECGVSQDCEDFKTLLEIEKGTAAWIERAQRLFEPHRLVTLQEIQDILLSATTVPAVPELYNSVRDLGNRASETAKEATDLVQRARTAQNLSQRPSAVDLFRVMKSLQTLPIQVDDADTLRVESENVKAWQDKVRKLFDFNRSQKSLDILLEEVLRNVRTITETSGQQPPQQQQQQQLQQDQIIPDFVNGGDKSQSKSKVYCVCRTGESGFMIECDQCHEWYHGPCVKLTRREAKSQTSYVCPICNGNQVVTHTTKRPRLEDISHVLKESDTLLFVPQAIGILADIVQRMQAYRSQVQAFCRSKTQLGLEDLSMILQYSRELEGLEVLLQDESEFLRQKIQNLSASAMSLRAVPSFVSSSNGSSTTTETEQMDVDEQQQQLYCLCRKPIDPDASNAEMVGCDSCHDWFHIDCVNLTSAAVRAIEHYMCPTCVEKTGANATTNTITTAKPRTPVIKLTIKPPNPPCPSSPQRNRKRKHTSEGMPSPTEDRRTKRRSVSDEISSPWITNSSTASLSLTKQQQ